MITWLKIGKSAHFYKKKRRQLSQKAITDLFTKIRQSHANPSNNIFRHVKEQLGRAYWSAIAFYYDADPAFLDLPAGEPRERACGFLMIVEYSGHIAIFRSGFDLTASFKTEYLSRLNGECVERAIARVDTTFQQISLRNMTASKYALRSKSLEASDLQNVVGPAGANRFVAKGYKVKQGPIQYSATPSTGRIAQKSDRAGHLDIVRWSCAVIDQFLDASLAPSQFIKRFARSIDLPSVPVGVVATAFAPDHAMLSEELYDSVETKRLLRRNGANFVQLTQAENETVLSALDQAFLLTVNRNGIFINDPRNNARIGSLAFNKSRIALKAFDLPEIDNIYIETDDGAAPGQGDCIKLKNHLNSEDMFIVLFSDLSLVYMEGTLYRDEQFSDGGETFLKYFHPAASLSNVTSEKGEFAAGQQAFSPNSMFRSIADTISAGDTILVCDDLVDEWADFIGINNSSNPKTITFYHAKHRTLSLGASPLHDVVGQAQKNFENMALHADTLAPKIAKWNSTYNANNVQTQIRRLVRGQAATLNPGIAEARSAPDAIRRAVIVTSALSKQQLEQAFANIRAGTCPSPHFVQLYWLLMSFFSACSEVSAFGSVICQP